MRSDDAIDFAATEETAADILLKLSDIAPFTLQEVDDGEAASEAPAGIPLRQRFLRFFTRLKR